MLSSQDLLSIQTLRTNTLSQIKERKQRGENVFDHLAIKALEGISERLNKIERALEINQYDLVFIGQVGSGKTTAICRLFDLIFEKEKTINNKKITVASDLLLTGGGRVTICEVVVESSEEICIEIEHYIEEDLLELIKDSCCQIWFKVYPRFGQGEGKIPEELMRAIRNITNLRIINYGNPQQVDHFEKLAEGFSEKLKLVETTFLNDADGQLQESDKVFQEFYQEVIKRANLSERIEKKVVISPSEDLNHLKSEVCKYFEDLNLGKLPNFPIPKKMFVKLNKSIFNLDKYFHVRKIRFFEDSCGNRCFM